MENSSGIIDDLSQDSSRCEKVGKNQDFEYFLWQFLIRGGLKFVAFFHFKFRAKNCDFDNHGKICGVLIFGVF